MTGRAGIYWPVLYSPAATVAMAAVPCDYTLTAQGEAALDADLAADAGLEPEAG